jgi:hypothetical protein
MIPQPNLFRCIIDAGTYFKAGKSKVTTQKSSLIPACVERSGRRGPHPCTGSRGPSTPGPSASPARGVASSATVPCFHDWRLKPSRSTCSTPTMIPLKLFREIVDAAGKRIGLGDFRPACKGPFGKFVVTAWKESEQKAAA